MGLIHLYYATLNDRLPIILRDGTREAMPCLPLLKDYQQYMKGFDRGDQIIGYYDIGQGSGGSVALLM